MGGSRQPDDLILPSKLLYFNVKDYRALGNGATDDRAAVQATINAALAAGGSVVFFPTGTHPCVVTGGISTFLLRGTGSSKLLFLGEERASHVTMAGNRAGTDRRLFDIKEGCKHIGFKSLKPSSTLTNEHEQQHLIHFECAPSSTDPETGRAFIIDCYFGHTKGDAIRFLGSDTERVKHLMPEETQREVAAMHPLGRMGTPEDVALATLFLASESSSWITGVTLDVAGGRVIV